MFEDKILKGDLALISRAVEESPLAPDLEAFLNSLELDVHEQTVVRETIEGLKFRGRGIQALPKNPPQIVAWGWV
jgi:hypothetical protein